MQLEKNFVMQKQITPFCHASTIIVLPNGDIYCCWFGGSYEGRADSAIFGSRCHAGVWEEPQKLIDDACANWNPVLFVHENGLVRLFYKRGQRIADWQTFTCVSKDNGLHWSAAQELVADDISGGRGPVRNKPIYLRGGRIVAGASTERGLWQAFADMSDDDGVTWQKSSPVVISGLEYKAGERTATSSIAVSEQSFYGRGVIQPSLWQGADGHVHMLLRSSEGHIFRSDSTDEGRSWCAAYALALPNNNSGLDMVRVADGTLFLVCNPVAANWGQRSPLTLFKSADDGATWQKVTDLETEDAEFSYPAIITHGDELVITYTWKRQNIACVRLNFVNL